MRKIILLPLLIVLVAGCVFGPSEIVTAPKGYGLEIVNFSSSIGGQIYSTQTNHLTMQIENQGESKIDDRFGLALLIIPSDWEILQDQENAQALKDLNFEDPVRGTAAGIQNFRWSVKAPPLAQGLSRTDTITGRIYYDYQTTATGSLWVYPESEYFAANERGDKLQTLTYETSRGPVAVDLRVEPDPVPVYSPNEIFTLTITLTNQDNGVVYQRASVDMDTPSVSDADRNRITLDINLPTGSDKQRLDMVDATCDDDVIFFGDTATVMCDIKVPKVPGTKQAYPISVTAYYGYYVDKEIEVTTIGREQIVGCMVDQDCANYPNERCDNGVCVKVVTVPGAYKLRASITSPITTTTPTPANIINYCPGMKFGANYTFAIVGTPSSDTATIRIDEGPKAGGELEKALSKGESWTTTMDRSTVGIKVDNIDTNAREIYATITITDPKVNVDEKTFTSIGSEVIVAAPAGSTTYNIKLESFANVSGAAYPQNLDNATFDINGQDLTVFRSKADNCINSIKVGDYYVGVGVASSAQGTSDTTATIDTIVAAGVSQQVVEEAIKYGFYKNSCADLKTITFDSSCTV